MRQVTQYDTAIVKPSSPESINTQIYHIEPNNPVKHIHFQMNAKDNIRGRVEDNNNINMNA